MARTLRGKGGTFWITPPKPDKPISTTRERSDRYEEMHDPVSRRRAGPDEDIRMGRYKEYDTIDDLVDDLEDGHED